MGVLATLWDHSELPDSPVEKFWAFAGSWSHLRYPLHKFFIHQGTDSLINNVRYHVRMFKVIGHGEDYEKYRFSQVGVVFSRIMGNFPSRTGILPSRFGESRVSLSMTIEVREDPDIVPKVKIEGMVDVQPYLLMEGTGLAPRDVPRWLFGYHLFQCLVWQAHNLWEMQWGTCLDRLDQSVQVEVSYSIKRHRMGLIMFKGRRYNGRRCNGRAHVR